MKIRPYLIADKFALLTLLRENSPDFFDPCEEKHFIYYLENQIEDYFVVILNGEILGCGGINYFPDQKTARLSWDIVSPSVQGKGIGSNLVAYRLQLIESNPNYNRIVVRTSQHAYRFYERIGFVTINVEVNYWALNLDLYEMERLNLTKSQE